MSQLKPLHQYPEEYYKLCKKAHQRPIALEFVSRRKAQNFRTEMYQFRTALRKALRSNPTSEELQLSALFAEGLAFSIRGTTLHITRKEPIHVQTIRDQL